MEEIGGGHLREKDAHAVLGELRNVGAGGLQARPVADRTPWMRSMTMTSVRQ